MNIKEMARLSGLTIVFLTSALFLTGCGELFDEPYEGKRFTAVVTIKNDCLGSKFRPYVGVSGNVIASPDPVFQSDGSYFLSYSESSQISIIFQVPPEGKRASLGIGAVLICSEGAEELGLRECFDDDDTTIGLVTHVFPPPDAIKDGATIHNTFTVTEMDMNIKCVPQLF